MNIKYYLPIFLLIILPACTSEDSEELGAENASAQINSIAVELNDDVVTLVQSKGVNGALSLIDLIENSAELGRISPYQPDENRAFVTRQVGQIAHSFTTGIARALGEEPAGFTEIKGVYVWNFDLQDFEKVDESNFLVIAFPVEGSTTNNGEFRLTEFMVVEIGGEEYPTTINADLTINEEKVVDLDFAVNWSSNGDPETAEIDLDVLPFSLAVRFDDTQSSTTSLAVTLLLDGSNLMGVDVDVEFDTVDKLEPVSISGEVSYMTLRIVGSVSDDQMDSSVDSNPND
jgi:hypothetical protein